MSAPSCLVFFGIRFTIQPEERTAIEERTDERVVRARRLRLNHYSGAFTEGAEVRHLLIGKKLANVGPENGLTAKLTRAALDASLLETEQKLIAGGWDTPPALFVLYEPD